MACVFVELGPLKLRQRVSWQHNLGMDNAAFAGVVMRHSVPLIDQLCPTAICSSGNDRFSLAALYQLDGAMKNSNMRFLLSQDILCGV